MAQDKLQRVFTAFKAAGYNVSRNRDVVLIWHDTIRMDFITTQRILLRARIGQMVIEQHPELKTGVRIRDGKH